MQLDLKKFFKIPNPGLRAYLDSVERGSDVVIRTPLFRNQPVEKVLNSWEAILNDGLREYPTLLEFENDLRSKVGPLSVRKPLRDRIADVRSYYESILTDSKPVSIAAINATLHEYAKVSGLRLRSVPNTIRSMRLDTNSGSPYFARRRSAVLAETVPFRIFEKNGLYYQQLHSQVFGAAAVLGWRGQEGGLSSDDVKQRVIWMFPFAVNIAELQLYQTLIAAIQAHRLVPAYVSQDCVEKTMTKLFDTKPKDDLIICTDFEKFDQHINPTLQWCSRFILSKLCNHGPEETMWLDQIYPIKYNIPIVLSKDIIYRGRHGMASGSGGTNADETLIHRSLQYEAAMSVGAQLNPYSQCLGDDGILTYKGIDANGVVAVYSQHGLSMNITKQHASTQEAIYLRRWYHRDYRPDGLCRGVYSTYRALGKLMYQERYFSEGWSNRAVALRSLSILNNLEWHPLREEFAGFVLKGDKYRLGLDIPDFFSNWLKMEQELTQFTEPGSAYYAHTKPIASWWIVKWLLKQR
jgi:hypothetical protein